MSEESAAAPAGHPTTIGPFAVLRKLGEGAMGVVYAGYDAALDRKVALKLIRRQILHKRGARARMIREAQAMARVSHPNVVQVYQVGEHEDQIYVAMEYVEGQTLSQWLRGKPRTWQEILQTLSAAGRGLAAVHAAGLVHRDFKPDNVLVGEDGSVRVVDFGLVHAESTTLPPRSTAGTVSASGPSLPPPELSLRSADPTRDERPRMPALMRLTQTGKLLGTPVYMSPEQHFGEAVGPHSDQFSFAITLYEALYGQLPFGGTTWMEIRQRVRRGEVPPPPRRHPAPRRIFQVIARALAPTPDQRWPSLEVMLDALARDPRRERLRALALVGLVAVAGLSYAAGVSQVEPPKSCDGAAEELVGVWDAPRQRAAERAFTATSAPFAADAWERVKLRLDDYAARWASAHQAVCEGHASGGQPQKVLDLRTVCLARRRAHLEALVDVLAAANRDVVEHAVQAAAALPSVESCEDTQALLANAPPPSDALVAEQVEALRVQLDHAKVRRLTGIYAEGLEIAGRVREEATALKFPPLVAEAALEQGSLLTELARPVEAEETLQMALHLALVHGLDLPAAEAAARLVFVIGDGLGRREAALATEPYASALVERARDDGLAALLRNNLGAVYDLRGDDDTAQTNYREAIALLRARPGEPDPLLAVVHHNLGEMLLDQGRYDAAREQLRQSAAVFTKLLGGRHPLVAHPLGGLADADRHSGRLAEARDRYTEARALMEASYGPENVYLIQPLTGLGRTLAAMDRASEAKTLLLRSVALAERHKRPHPMVAEALEGLGGLAEDDGRREEARAYFERAVRMYDETIGAADPVSAPAALRAGELSAALGDRAAATVMFERVLAVPLARKELASVRMSAALGLARALSEARADPTRACQLADEAAEGFVLGDPRREHAAALRRKVCSRL